MSDNLVAGHILLCRTTSLTGRAIRLLDGTEVSHAAPYLGGHVTEALSRPGLVERSIEESTDKKNTNWVAVMRKQPTPGSMTPVLQVAWNYLDQGNRYGYEQILLLAAICLTRKLDLGNPLLRRMALAATGKAADLVNDLTARGKEPMICSEFVFRAYDEAMDAEDDPYSFEISSQATGEPQRWFVGLRNRTKRRRGRTPAEIPTRHPDSLVGQLQPAGETSASTSAWTGKMAAAVPQTREDLDPLIEQYSAEGERAKSARRPTVAAGPAVSLEEMRASARRLTAELTDAAAPKMEIEKNLYGASKDVATARLQTLADIVADLVTTGDLLKSPSLERVGTINP